jgi:hypothetical protein
VSIAGHAHPNKNPAIYFESPNEVSLISCSIGFAVGCLNFLKANGGSELLAGIAFSLDDLQPTPTEVIIPATKTKNKYFRLITNIFRFRRNQSLGIKVR